MRPGLGEPKRVRSMCGRATSCWRRARAARTRWRWRRRWHSRRRRQDCARAASSSITACSRARPKSRPRSPPSWPGSVSSRRCRSRSACRDPVIRAAPPARRPRPGRPGTRLSTPPRTTPAHRPFCSGTPSTIRPRPSCSGSLAGRGPGRWPGCPPVPAGICGRCSGCAATRPGRPARLSGWSPGTTRTTPTAHSAGSGSGWTCSRPWRRRSALASRWDWPGRRGCCARTLTSWMTSPGPPPTGSGPGTKLTQRAGGRSRRSPPSPPRSGTASCTRRRWRPAAPPVPSRSGTSSASTRS